MDMWNQIAEQIHHATGRAFRPTAPRSVGGGCINSSYTLTDGTQTYFVKLNAADQVAMFEAELLGLQAMLATQTIRVPRPICWGVADRSAYLVLERLDLGSGGSPAWGEMGRQLARMHQVTSDRGFGWHRDNTIGSTPQRNTWTDDWVEFWTRHRIGYQLQLAQRRGGHFPQSDRLLAAMPTLLAGHRPAPSLVHGDLWSGNAAVTTDGEPVIFDPAVYYGDREVDLAMTELFGRFPAEFYSGYHQVYPLAAGYPQRKVLYNLYHILNHFNLFGGGYAAQANSMMTQLLAQV